MNEPRDDVAVFQVEVVIGTIDIGGNDTSEHAAVLLVVCPSVLTQHIIRLDST